jgi:hypothetical protein
MSVEEVPVSAGHEILVEVDDTIVLIVSDPCGILGQQLRPRPIHLLYIIFTLVTFKLIIDY